MRMPAFFRYATIKTIQGRRMIMIDLSISNQIVEKVPQFKLGVIHYRKIVVSDSPQMLHSRMQLLQEQLKLEYEGTKLAVIDEIQQWRRIVKTLGVDPSKYRHSAEALMRRVMKGDFLPSINSAVDVTNLLSLQYKIPFGIYDVNKLQPPIQVYIGAEHDEYEALNGRMYHLVNKLTLADKHGAFGSPFVDSKRTSVTDETTECLQIVYLLPSIDNTKANRQLETIAHTFYSFHGGDYEYQLIEG